MWGKRAECTLLGDNIRSGGISPADSNSQTGNGANSDGSLYIEAMHDGYAPVPHKRRFDFNGENELLIMDTLTGIYQEMSWQLSFVTGKAFSSVTLETESEADSGDMDFQTIWNTGEMR